MDFGEARKIVQQGENKYKMFKRLGEVIDLVAAREAQLGDMERATIDLAHKENGLKAQIEAAQVRLKEDLEVMEAKSAEAQIRYAEEVSELTQRLNQRSSEVENEIEVLDKDMSAYRVTQQTRKIALDDEIASLTATRDEIQADLERMRGRLAV